MNIIKFYNDINRIDSLIRLENTGTADEFAATLSISKRTLHENLQQLREIGAEIVYDSYNRTYKYTQKGRIVFAFLSDEMKQIKGGITFVTEYLESLLPKKCY